MNQKIHRKLESIRIRDLPRRKVCRVAPTTSLGEVYRLLEETHSVAVLVCDSERRLLGIFTERDVLSRTALEGDPATPIDELMVPLVATLRPDDSLVEAIRIMAERRIRHIPVVGEDGREVGLVGGRDVLRLLAEQFPKTLLNLPPRLDQTMTTPEGG